MDSINLAQRDMRQAYYYGVPGVIASGTAWGVAGVVALAISPIAGIVTLIAGGTLIFPVSVVLCKCLGRSGKHEKTNPLAPLAIEGTIWMLFSIPVAVAAAYYSQSMFFPAAMMLVIGGRYLTFSTLYGIKTYWLFAAVLFAAGLLCAMLQAPVAIGALTGGLVEWFFAAVIAWLNRGRPDRPAQV
ncbi:hypothetical protein QWI17_22790 [Gilvimarinus sp. SDUM040013]|uniref:DUF308 domain-containing protein n=1 Tax=Gilvimarinus gilvus TaxID=3058038 RepID=A0ABU4RZD5_9GAMM|nr:hypothetical protein [Gilvimarinus sp. SDUM040013]MDO3388692.1 hypothetical protein [Gilvimarinus sp. SDUM040013]MDX6849587.1 hypothetical protein [Gilvimarinus sp. SDUM040013]